MNPRLQGVVPEAVRELAERLGAKAPSGPGLVHIGQSGRMRQDDQSAWMRFRAKQTIWRDRCAFDWRARTGPGGLVSVRDALRDGEGRLAAKLLGLIPVARAGGTPDVTRGELMRYLAELAWAPDAMLANPALLWDCEAPDRMVVSAGEGEHAAQVAIQFDTEGRIGETFAPDRPRAVGKRFVPTPWRGWFFDYRRHEGRWLPFGGRVAWVVGGVEMVCWEGRVESWTMASG